MPKLRERLIPVSGTAAGRYRHGWWALCLLVYLALFAYAEKVVTTQYWVSWLPIDDHIPFVPFFVYFYVFWYPFQLLTAVWLFLRDGDAFRRYIWSFSIGFNSSILFCLLFPNGQNLRPAAVPGEGLAAALIRGIYAVDTNTNVLPSTHVIGSLLVVFAAFDSPSVSRPWRIAAIIAAILINLSTVCIKQHSILDLYVGLAVSAAVYGIVYRGIRPWQEKRRAGRLAPTM